MYYVVDYETEEIVQSLYKRPDTEYLNDLARQLCGDNPAGCSLYVIEGHRISGLEGYHYPTAGEGGK
jgi:hypothetical protein